MSAYPGVDFANEKFSFIRELGRGNFGVTVLMQNKHTGEEVAAKIIKRGAQVLPPWATPTSHPRAHRRPLLSTAVRACRTARPVVAAQINVNVERELLNHRPLYHPHIIRFMEVHAAHVCLLWSVAVMSTPPIIHQLKPAAGLSATGNSFSHGAHHLSSGAGLCNTTLRHAELVHCRYS